MNIVYGNLSNDRIARWRLLLEEFGAEFVHVKGKDNVVADALSRMDADFESPPEILNLHYTDIDDGKTHPVPLLEKKILEKARTWIKAVGVHDPIDWDRSMFAKGSYNTWKVSEVLEPEAKFKLPPLSPLLSRSPYTSSTPTQMNPTATPMTKEEREMASWDSSIKRNPDSFPLLEDKKKFIHGARISSLKLASKESITFSTSRTKRRSMHTRKRYTRSIKHI
jgi:hypothetical protein